MTPEQREIIKEIIRVHGGRGTDWEAARNRSLLDVFGDRKTYQTAMADAARDILHSNAPLAAMQLADAAAHPEEDRRSAVAAAAALLDRVGLVKKTEVTIEHTQTVVLFLPEKQPDMLTIDGEIVEVENPLLLLKGEKDAKEQIQGG